MKVWIAGISTRKGWIIWRWSTKTEEGTATTRGMHVPNTIYEAGPDAVHAALEAILVIFRDDLRPGWRPRRAFFEKVPFQEQLMEVVANVVSWMAQAQTRQLGQWTPHKRISPP